MFGRWSDEQDCLSEMCLIHDEDDAQKIVDGIRMRVDSNTLYKFAEDVPFQVISKSDEEIIVYGPCTWEKRDPVNDVVTTQWMTSFFNKLFNVVEERLQNCMVDHRNWQGGWPLRKYEVPGGDTFYTHVHEKGAMLVSKIRDDDGLYRTKRFRELVKGGLYHMYSVSGDSPRVLEKMEDVNGVPMMVKYHYDGEPIEITYCRKGMNDMAEFSEVTKAAVVDFYGEISPVEKAPRTNAERAMSHNDISQEDWDKLSDDEKKKLIDDLPDRGTATKEFPNGNRVKSRRETEEIEKEVAELVKAMTIEQVDAKIADLRVEIRELEDTVDAWYESREQMPDDVRAAQTRAWELRDEVYAYLEAKAELIVANATEKPDKSAVIVTHSSEIGLRQDLKLRKVIEEMKNHE